MDKLINEKSVTKIENLENEIAELKKRYADDDQKQMNNIKEREKMSNDEWITPKWIIDKLGPFDLDPCAHSQQPWPTATRMISLPQDGLTVPWEGRVWLNPPYSRGSPPVWLRLMVEHNHGTALINASINSHWFHDLVFNCASALLFQYGRISFCAPAGTAAGSPRYDTVIAAYGMQDAARLMIYSNDTKGRLIMLDIN